MIYDSFGTQIEIIEVKSPELVTVKYFDDQSTEDVNPRTLRADGGLPELIEAMATTFTSYKQPIIEPQYNKPNQADP